VIVEETGPTATLADVLDRLLARGVVVRGEIWLTVADVELVYIGAQLVLVSPDALKRADEAAA
jgi:hypothetical protein